MVAHLEQLYGELIFWHVRYERTFRACVATRQILFEADVTSVSALLAARLFAQSKSEAMLILFERDQRSIERSRAEVPKRGRKKVGDIAQQDTHGGHLQHMDPDCPLAVEDDAAHALSEDRASSSSSGSDRTRCALPSGSARAIPERNAELKRDEGIPEEKTQLNVRSRAARTMKLYVGDTVLDDGVRPKMHSKVANHSGLDVRHAIPEDRTMPVLHIGPAHVEGSQLCEHVRNANTPLVPRGAALLLSRPVVHADAEPASDPGAKKRESMGAGSCRCMIS